MQALRKQVEDLKVVTSHVLHVKAMMKDYDNLQLKKVVLSAQMFNLK